MEKFQGNVLLGSSLKKIEKQIYNFTVLMKVTLLSLVRSFDDLIL
jgi:hypothetical protein